MQFIQILAPPPKSGSVRMWRLISVSPRVPSSSVKCCNWYFWQFELKISLRKRESQFAVDFTHIVVSLCMSLLANNRIIELSDRLKGKNLRAGSQETAKQKRKIFLYTCNFTCSLIFFSLSRSLSHCVNGPSKKTRMHSSRMRTVRNSSRLLVGSGPGGLSGPWGVTGPGGSGPGGMPGPVGWWYPSMH